MEFQKLDKFAALLPEYIVGTRCEDHPHTGHTEQIRWGFPNNYGASVVCHNSSYGGAPEFVVLHDGRVWAASPVRRALSRTSPCQTRHCIWRDSERYVRCSWRSRHRMMIELGCKHLINITKREYDERKKK